MTCATAILVSAAAILLAFGAGAQPLDEHCTIAILNRAARVAPDGTYRIPNLPTPLGAVRARVVCQRDGLVSFGHSPFATPVPNGETRFGPIEFTDTAPIPETLRLSAEGEVVREATGPAQLTTTAVLLGGATVNVTGAAAGTAYRSSNPLVASVSPDGLVTPLRTGTILVTAVNEGAMASLELHIEAAAQDDADGDGLPDSFEEANAADPGGWNLARRVGVQVIASSADAASPPARAIDGDLATSWRTVAGDAVNQGGSPFLEIVLPSEAALAQVRLFGNRTPANGADVLRAVLEVRDASGTPIAASADLRLPTPVRDLTVPLAAAAARSIRLRPTRDEGVSPGIAEIELIAGRGGSGLDPNDPADAALDFDGDGLTNLVEFERGTSLFLADTDDDRLDDAAEVAIGSSPLAPDTDGDGLLDSREVAPGVDSDADGSINARDTDSDADLLNDAVEVAIGLDPTRANSDGDGISDANEDTDGDGLPNLEEQREGLDPGNRDSDYDEMVDGTEALAGRDPKRADGMVLTTVGAFVAELPSAGQLRLAPGATRTLIVTLVGEPAAEERPVEIVNVTPSVALAASGAFVAAGARTAAVEIRAVANGVARVRLRVGGETTELEVLVGEAAQGSERPVLSPIVGIEPTQE